MLSVQITQNLCPKVDKLVIFSSYNYHQWALDWQSILVVTCKAILYSET